tara:strand:+ start:1860 stop:2024 length:165 start_codon:yes stop_codon:yes gene_type:complete
MYKVKTGDHQHITPTIKKEPTRKKVKESDVFAINVKKKSVKNKKTSNNKNGSSE